MPGCRHCSYSGADQLRQSITVFHCVTNCTFATVRASFNIIARCLPPSTEQNLEVAMHCDLLIDNTAEHRQPQLSALLVLPLITVTKNLAPDLLLCDVRNNDVEFLWRRHVRVQLFTLFLPSTWSIIKEANSAIVNV